MATREVTVRRARLKSLAKVNLDLRVLHKRSDGFHELRTVFQTISLADVIEVEYQPGRRTELSINDTLAIPDNLILRAAKSVLEAMRVKARVHFRLTKRIPMGGGLGGGSSNAAAVLLALPVLAGRTLSVERLSAIAAELGSDVPFFLTGGTALGLGRGEELYPLPDAAAEPILVVAPGVHVSTPEAYRALNRSLTFTGSSSSINDFQAFVRTLATVRSARVAIAFGANDFEAAVFRQHPQLKTIAGKLRKPGGAGVRMSGSGSAVFAIFGSRAERALAETMLKKDRVLAGCRILPASLVSRSGYQRLWRGQLAEHLASSGRANEQPVWPPQSRYEQ